MEDRYGDYFEGCMGAEAIKKRCRTSILKPASKQLREEIDTGTGQRKARALKRLKVVNAFLTTGNKPEAMVLDVIPVIPRICARWCSSTVAVSPLPISTTSTVV